MKRGEREERKGKEENLLATFWINLQSIHFASISRNASDK